MDFSCCKGGIRSTGLEDIPQQITCGDKHVQKHSELFIFVYKKETSHLCQCLYSLTSNFLISGVVFYINVSKITT
jgi:hypothetical protein